MCVCVCVISTGSIIIIYLEPLSLFFYGAVPSSSIHFSHSISFSHHHHYHSSFAYMFVYLCSTFLLLFSSSSWKRFRGQVRVHEILLLLKWNIFQMDSNTTVIQNKKRQTTDCRIIGFLDIFVFRSNPWMMMMIWSFEIIVSMCLCGWWICFFLFFFGVKND